MTLKKVIKIELKILSYNSDINKLQQKLGNPNWPKTGKVYFDFRSNSVKKTHVNIKQYYMLTSVLNSVY